MSAKLDEISRRLKKAIEVDDHVVITKDRVGIVRYKGPIDGKNGIFYGIELNKGNGKTNGVYKGKQYFVCKKNKGIFVDKKQILYKKDPNKTNHERKRSSISQKTSDIFHSEYLKTKFGKWYDEEGIDPIDIIINNSNWYENALNATTWKEKWQLMKEFMKIICDDEYGKLDLPNRFIPNHDYNEQIFQFFVKWLKEEKHLGLRKHILKIMVPWCKTYEISESYANELAATLIQKQWKETKYGFRSLVTKALLSIYYASECILENWKVLLIPVIKSRSDVRVQVWNFLAQVCILGSKSKNSYKKQKALLDIETLLCDSKIISLTKQTINNHNDRGDKIGFACSEFIFGAKYILPEMKMINSVYNEIKTNGMIMNDVAMDEYCQILIKGDNAFDLYERECDIISRRKLWDQTRMKCDYCSKNGRKLKDITTKVDKIHDNVEYFKDIVNELRNNNNEYEEELNKLRRNVITTEKKTKLLQDDMKDIEIEIFNLKREIYKFRKKEKRKMIKKSKMNKLDLLHWDKWNCTDLMQWILSLDNGRYIKYQHVLQKIIPIENIKGKELKMINNNDLLLFGINDKQDRILLIKYINNLINNKSKIPEMSLSPPPMAFMNENIHYGGIYNIIHGHHHQHQHQQEGFVMINHN